MSTELGLLGGGLHRVLEKVGLQNVVGVEAVLDALRDDVDWIASAATPEQRAKLEGPKQLAPADIDNARNRALQAETELWRQGAHDERIGQLDRMRTQL